MPATAPMTEVQPETPNRDAGDRPGAVISAGQLATLLGGELLGSADASFGNVAPIEHARPGDMTFIRAPKFAAMWERSRASIAVLHRDVTPPRNIGEGRAIVVVPDTDVAQLKILGMLAGPTAAPEPGIDPSARVHPTASVDPTARVGPMCVVGARAKVGARTHLISGVHLGDDASIGTETIIGPNSSIMDRCVVGNHCRVAGCVVIGADGFGYTLQSHPSGRGKYLVHIPHIGNVTIGDHVDIGANTCIDRAKFGSTTVGSGTKIDNLVQIGHNCRIGRSCVICGQVGLSGSVTLGDGVQLAGRVGVADNLHIGSMARVGASAGVMNDIPPGETWLGAPALPMKEAARNMALFRRLSQILKKIKIDHV